MKTHPFALYLAAVSAACLLISSAATAEDKVDIAPYLAKADLEQGKKLINRCTICHSFEKGKPNMVGPNQFDLLGRKMASVAGFNYSPAFKAKSAETWDFQKLSDYIAAPMKAVPGTRMAFAGIAKPEERAALIAYINQTYSEKPLPLPK